MQIFGGAGYNTEYPVEKLCVPFTFCWPGRASRSCRLTLSPLFRFRDSKIFQLYEVRF